MLIEQRSVVKSLDKDDGFIAPGKTLKVSFETGRRDYPVERRLRVVGEVGVFWKWRQEAGFPEYVYRSIEDALDPADAWKEKYSLLLRGQGETYPRNAYLKIPRLDFQPGADYETFRKGIEHSDPAIAANVTIGLVKVTTYLLDRQLKQLEKAFVEEGGLSERMTRARLNHRAKQRGK